MTEEALQVGDVHPNAAAGLATVRRSRCGQTRLLIPAVRGDGANGLADTLARQDGVSAQIPADGWRTAALAAARPHGRVGRSTSRIQAILAACLAACSDSGKSY